jgi:hypothetical protein
MERILNYVPAALHNTIQIVHHAAANIAAMLEDFYQGSGGFSAVTFVCDTFNEFCVYLSASGCLVVNLLD